MQYLCKSSIRWVEREVYEGEASDPQLEHKSLRVGFEPLYSDFTRKGVYFLPFLLFKVHTNYYHSLYVIYVVAC
jgi:hypothetical protein